MATEHGTVCEYFFDVKQGSDVEIFIRRELKYRIQAILYHRTTIGGVLDVEVHAIHKGVEFLIRRLPAFSSADWVFNPDIDFPKESRLRIRTVGASGTENHALLVYLAT